MENFTLPPDPAPSRGQDVTTFNQQVAAFVAWCQVHTNEMNALLPNLATISTSSTLTANLALSVGEKTISSFSNGVNTSFFAGMHVVLTVRDPSTQQTDPNKWMYGQITSVTNSGQNMVIDIQYVQDDGSTANYIQWNINATAPMNL